MRFVTDIENKQPKQTKSKIIEPGWRVHSGQTRKSNVTFCRLELRESFSEVKMCFSDFCIKHVIKRAVVNKITSW